MPVCASEANTAEAVQALVAFEDGCKRAEGLWPAKLCGPIVLVDPSTRAAVANQPDPAGRFKRQDGMFVGEWPASMDVANTAVDWEDTRWALVMLPLPEDPFGRLQLLAHESFHRIQPELGPPPGLLDRPGQQHRILGMHGLVAQAVTQPQGGRIGAREGFVNLHAHRACRRRPATNPAGGG